VLPDFKARAAERVREKERELAPCIEAALARKDWMRPLSDDEIPELQALGRQIVEQTPELKGAAASGSGGLSIPLRDPLSGPR
jgi:predicted exporter